MTDDATFAATDEELPGLGPAPRGASALEMATRRTITQLQTLGLVDERHAMVCQLLLDLAVSIDAGTRQGKASAVAMAAAQMLAAYDVLCPTDEGGGVDDGYGELTEDLRRIAANVARDVGSATAIRDPS